VNTAAGGNGISGCPKGAGAIGIHLPAGVAGVDVTFNTIDSIETAIYVEVTLIVSTA